MFHRRHRSASATPVGKLLRWFNSKIPHGSSSQRNILIPVPTESVWYSCACSLQRCTVCCCASLPCQSTLQCKSIFRGGSGGITNDVPCAYASAPSSNKTNATATDIE